MVTAHGPVPLPTLPIPEERKALRVAVGWSIKQAAADLKVSRETYRKWENGNVTPRPDNLRLYWAQLESFHSALVHNQ